MTPRRDFRLDGRIGWRAAASTGVSAGRDGLTLAAIPGTAIPLAAPDGSLAGMALPMHVAAGPEGTLFLLDSSGAVLAWDPCLERFAPIACLSVAPRRPGLARPVALAWHSAGDLLVLDGDTKSVTAIRVVDGYPRLSFGPFAVEGDGLRAVPAVVEIDPLSGCATGEASAPPGAWDPVDLGVLPDGRIVVSDRAANLLRVFDRRGCLRESWSGATEDAPKLVRPTALAIANDGRIAVVEEDEDAVAVLDRDGRIVARFTDPGAIAGDWGRAGVAFDLDGTIWISGRRDAPAYRIGRDCAGQCGAPEPVCLTPAHCALLAFDSEGHAILGTPRNPCPMRADMTGFAPTGTLTTGALDSGMTGTVWDRITLDLSVLEGTTLTVETFVSDAPLGDIEVAALDASAWTASVIARDDEGRAVLAIRSGPGRHLWLRLTLAGDGKTTPCVTGITVTSPRRTSARLLPATYSAEPVSADFLARFMLLFDQLRAEMLAPIDALPALFDPRATPAAEADTSGEDFLDWLAAWIGIALDRGWSVERRRRLVREAPALFRIRGTALGLKRHVAVYTGVEPRLVEHFRLRRWLALDEAQLDGNAQLWGPDIVRRLQLDEYSEIGRFALVDGDNPLTDPVGAYAHRATLYVPVGEGFGDRDLAAIENVVEAAAPAHVVVDIRLMRPRFIIGCDLLLGVNTVLGRDIRTARADEAVLGEPVVLAGPPEPFTLGPGLRLGADTILQ
ncbi:phage tail protein [Sphingomonas sp. Root241]|uniref:phage tail protein n=1 Tax=Sphingomonas sp. Root241 TaxID=1736501 RepID=UPI0006FEEC05|nr:phage tail protein [Sphingomonas sp. Root241]KRC81832.1 hypothetical protein ASE13_05575 [Sphingomonas sp. Root241]